MLAWSDGTRQVVEPDGTVVDIDSTGSRAVVAADGEFLSLGPSETGSEANGSPEAEPRPLDDLWDLRRLDGTTWEPVPLPDSPYEYYWPDGALAGPGYFVAAGHLGSGIGPIATLHLLRVLDAESGEMLWDTVPMDAPLPDGIGRGRTAIVDGELVSGVHRWNGDAWVDLPGGGQVFVGDLTGSLGFEPIGQYGWQRLRVTLWNSTPAMPPATSGTTPSSVQPAADGWANVTVPVLFDEDVPLGPVTLWRWGEVRDPTDPDRAATSTWHAWFVGVRLVAIQDPSGDGSTLATLEVPDPEVAEIVAQAAETTLGLSPYVEGTTCESYEPCPQAPQITPP
jgi:hypothetical protein